MESRQIFVRPARPDDWAAIWTILRDVAAKGDTFTYPLDLDEPTGRDMWLSGANSSATLVGISPEGTLFGSAKIGANHRGPGAHVATGSFIVAASARRLGVGRALLEAALVQAKSLGFEAIQFNAVASSNIAAIELYLSERFAVVGSVPEAFRHPVHGDVALLVMHRRL